MANVPPSNKSGDTSVSPDRSSTSGTPRWVKVFVIITLVVILLFAISLLTGVRHGPEIRLRPLATPAARSGSHRDQPAPLPTEVRQP